MDNLKRVLPNSENFDSSIYDGGFIQSARGFKDHWIYKDADFFRAWITMLHDASWKDNNVKHNRVYVDLFAGEFVSTIPEMMELYSLSERRLRALLKRLEDYGMIERFVRSKHSIIRICFTGSYRDHVHPKKGKVSGQRSDRGQTEVRQRSAFSKVSPVNIDGLECHNKEKKDNKENIYIDSDNFSEEKKESGDRIISHASQGDKEKILSEGNTEKISIDEVRKELQKFESLRGCDSVHYFERVKVWCLEKDKLSESKGYKLSKVIQFALNDSKRGELVIVGQKPSGSGRSEANSLPDDFGIRSPKAVKMPDSLVRKINE